MSINKKVPFFRNSGRTRTRCFQAVLRMVLKYFEPGEDFSWMELDLVTQRPRRGWTSPMAGLSWLAARDYEVLSVKQFDYDEFVASPELYLTNKLGKKAAAAQLKKSNLKAELYNLSLYRRHISHQNRQPEAEDIKQLLARGYLVIANINFQKLNRLPGYAAHFVLVTGVYNKGFIIHDPGGLKGKAYRRVSFKRFNTAWAYPNSAARSLIAIRHNFLANTPSVKDSVIPAMSHLGNFGSDGR